MSARIAFDSWQLLLPAIGLAIFAVVFAVVVWRVWRMQPPAVGRLESMPLEAEETCSPVAGRAGPGPKSSPCPPPRGDLPPPAHVNSAGSITHVR